MSQFDHLIPVMQRVLESEVILGPAVASAGVGGLDKNTYDIVYQHASELTAEICGNKTFSITMHPGIEVTPPVVRFALVEAISTTAAYLSHIRLGYLNIDESMVLVAHRLVRKVIADCGRDDVFTLGFIVNTYDNCKLVHHYGRVLISQFVSGELHRPWIQYTLDLELAAHLLTETMKIVVEDGQQYVVLTDVGEHRYQQFAEFLRDSGFLRRRVDIARRSQFSQMADYDGIVQSVSTIEQARSQILHECGIRPGMRVLEVGCGTGEMTLSSGLYQLTGSEGHVMATDPSIGMLARAREKQKSFPEANVQFVEAAAEDLPFEDNSFDAVVGCAFLHFTDIPRVLKEIHRVSKPNAVFTTNYALQFANRSNSEFFLEWFAPVLTSRNSRDESNILPSETSVSNAIKPLPYADVRIEAYEVIGSYQSPEMMVKFMVQVGNFFDDTMEELPWKAQQDMIRLLIGRGHDVLKKYGPERLVQSAPWQFLQARVAK